MTPARDPGGPLTVLSASPDAAEPGNHPAQDGPGLFEIAGPGQAQGTRHVTTVRRLAGAGRAPGTVLISAAAWLLVAIGGGALYVSFDAQRQYVFAVRHHQAASIIEALLLDLLMIVFTLLALGLSRAGKSSRTERALILACAVASAYMNVSDADTASPRSVAAYILAPLALAVVVDRVVAVIRRHVLADDGTLRVGRARPRRGRRRAPRRPAGPVRAAVRPRPARNRHRPAPLHPAGRPAAARTAPYRRPVRTVRSPVRAPGLGRPSTGTPSSPGSLMRSATRSTRGTAGSPTTRR